MTDNLPPLPQGFVPADEQSQTASGSGLPPLPAGFEPADNQSVETAGQAPTGAAAQPGAFQTAPNQPIHNTNNPGVQSVMQQLDIEKQNPNAAGNRERQFHSTMTTPEQRFQRAEASVPVEQRLENPVTTNDLMSQDYQKNHPIQAGLTDLATGLFTPKNLAIMAATEGLGTLAGPESVAASRVSRALSTYFTADQIHGIIKESPEAWEAFKKGDASTALRLATHIIGTAGFSALSAQHAAGGEATPATRFGEKADQFVDNATNRVKQSFRSDQNAMDVANSRHQSATVEHAQRQREADIAPGQAIDARKNAETLQAAYEQGLPAPVDRTNSQLHQQLADHFGLDSHEVEFGDLENRLNSEITTKQRAGGAPTPDEVNLQQEILKQDQADAQRPPVTKKQVDDANTLASKAAANSRKATQALVDSHEALNTAQAEVDRMGRHIEETQSGMSSVTKTVLKKLGLGGLNAEESMVKAGRPNVNSDQRFRGALQTAAPALLNATDGVKVKTVGQFEDLLHDKANSIREDEFNPMIQRHADEEFDGRSIADNIRQAISPQMREYAPHDAEELEDFASKFNKNITLEKAESDLQYFNAELKKFYRMNAVDQGAALKTSGTVAKYEAAADGLRDTIHQKLNDLGETGHEEAQAQYGALKDLERVFAKRATVADRQAPLSLPQILSYAGGLGEAAAYLLHSPGTAIAGAVPIVTSIAAKHVNSPEYLIRSGLKKMRAEMDARTTVPEPPSREFSPLHSELATTYGEDVRDTSYQELQSRLAEDMKLIRGKMRRGVTLDTVENNKLAQYGQINAQNAADQIAQQKDAEKLQQEQEKLPQPNLPIGAEPLLEIPSSRLDPKFDTQKAIVHDIAHHVVGDKMGLDFIDGIRSHEHPTNQNSGALMSAPIDWSPFLDEDGKVDPGKLKSKINAIVATYVAGGVANDLYHGISFAENPHLGADMDILKNFLKKRGLNEAEVSKVIAQGVDDAAKVLSQPGTREIIEQHAAVREPGLSNQYQVSPERMEQIKNDLRGGYNEPTARDAGAVSGESEQRSSGNGPGAKGNTEAGNPSKVRKEAEATEAANKAAGTEPAEHGTSGKPDTVGPVPEENRPLKRPPGGWGEKEEKTPEPPEMGRALHETALPHEYDIKVTDKDGNEETHTVEAHSSQAAMNDLQDTLGSGNWKDMEVQNDAKGRRTPNTNYEIPAKKPTKMRQSFIRDEAGNYKTRTEEQTLRHELGHVMGGHVNGIPYESIISHRHPLVSDDPNARAAALPDLSQFKNERGRFDRQSIGQALPKLVEGLMGGIAADELFGGESRERLKAKTGSSDIATARMLGKNLGLSENETETAIDNAIDSVKQKLSHPVTSQIIKENAPFRESNLSKAYHYSEERLNNIRAEHDRRMREYEQTNGKSSVGAAEQRSVAGNTGEQNPAGGPAEGAVSPVPAAGTGAGAPNPAPEVKPFKVEWKPNGKYGVVNPKGITLQEFPTRELAETEAQRAAEQSQRVGAEQAAIKQVPVAGLRERTTGDLAADAAIKQAGAIPAGIMFPGEDYELKSFHDPKTGSTLNFRKNEPVTPETVKAKLDESRKAYGITNENIQKPTADMTRAELKTELGVTGDDPRNGLSNKTLQKQLEKQRAETPESPKFGKIAEAANKFNEERGREPIIPGAAHNPEVAKRIADAYDQMKHDPNNPAVKASYDEMKKDIDDQWNYARDKMGIEFEPWDKPGQPYQNSKQMVDDVKNNNHLSFFRGGDMPADHPLAETDPETGLTYNDKLRAIHDLFGHAANDNKFGPKGEENAWNEHRQMFSPEALPAVTSETRGQNSWVNFGSHLRNEAGNIPAKGEAGYIPPSSRLFAEQKAGILPAEFQKPNPVAGQYHPELQKIADKFGVHNDPAKAIQGPSFVTPDGKFISLGGTSHDAAIDFAQGSPQVKGDNRVPFIKDTSAIRVRPTTDREGDTLHLSVPNNVSPEQINSLKQIVTENGRYGNVKLERADITPETKDQRSTYKEFARPGDVEPMLQQIGAHPDLPASPKLGPKGSTVPLMKNPLEIKGTAENDRVNTPDVAKALNQFTKKKIGSLELGDNDQKMVDRAKKLAEDEAKYQLATANSGKAWYTADIGVHDGVLDRLRPELQDPAKRSIFKFAEAVLSNGQKPYANFKSAIKAWDHYNETGEFPPTNPDTGKSWGPRGAAGYGNALQMINRLVKEKGEQGTSDWMLSEHPVKELREYNSSVSGKANDMALGAMILGPKRGPFAQNLHGIESAFTADMWVSRTWNRWMGTLDTNPGSDGDTTPDAPKNLQERKLMEQSFSETADKLGLSTSALQAVLWYYEQGLYDVHGAKKESWSFADAAKRVEKEHGEQNNEGFKFGANENKPAPGAIPQTKAPEGMVSAADFLHALGGRK